MLAARIVDGAPAMISRAAIESMMLRRDQPCAGDRFTEEL
jgi:hypothetical protein